MMSPLKKKKSPNSSKNADVVSCLRFLETIKSLDPEFPLHYTITLVIVYQNPGMSLTELADKTNLALSTVSRIISALSKYRPNGKPYELLEVKTSEAERRRKEIYLSDKGQKFVEKMVGYFT